MKKWAEHQIKLSKPDKNKTSLKDHLLQVERQTGRTPPELIPPVEFPGLLLYVWNAFTSLSDTRQQGLSGLSGITYLEMKAWMDLTKTRLSPRDVQLVMDLDKIYLKVMNSG